jgi:GlcNAc-P-P-Und epimerase
MNVLVTGGSGFIGTNLIELLLELSHKILNIDKVPPRNTEHQNYWEECNILDKQKMYKLISDFNPEWVVHLAAKTGVYEKSVDEFIDNTEGTMNLIEILKSAGSVRKVIFTSSLLVCKMGYIPKHETDYMPSTPYGESKVEMEKIIRATKVPYSWTIIRPISIWGPWFGEPYKNFFKAISQGWYFHIGHGRYKRSLGYVENLTNQISMLLEKSRDEVDQRTYYVADENPLDLYVLANEVSEQLGRKPIKHVPYPIMKAIALVGDILLLFNLKFFPMSSFRLNNIMTEYVYDLTPIIEIAGSSPNDYKTAVKKTLDWMKTSGDI